MLVNAVCLDEALIVLIQTQWPNTLIKIQSAHFCVFFIGGKLIGPTMRHLADNSFWMAPNTKSSCEHN